MTITPAQCKEGRRVLAWSVEELAYTAGLGRNTIGAFERGQRATRPETLAAIVEALKSAGVVLAQHETQEREAMTYRLVQLAPGSYDVELGGQVVASLVKSATSKRWSAELLDESGPRPAPFRKAAHWFGTLNGAQEWLGDPELVPTPGGAFARRTILSRAAHDADTSPRVKP